MMVLALTRAQTMRQVLDELRRDDFRIVDELIERAIRSAAWRDGVQQEHAKHRAAMSVKACCFCPMCFADDVTAVVEIASVH
jgi:hypothetical protein